MVANPDFYLSPEVGGIIPSFIKNIRTGIRAAGNRSPDAVQRTLLDFNGRSYTLGCCENLKHGDIPRPKS